MATNMRGLTQVRLTPAFHHKCIFLNIPLIQFIADIRGARVRELEEKRINKEMANIRKRFKGIVSSLVLDRDVTEDHSYHRRKLGWVPEKEVRLTVSVSAWD